LRTQPRIIDYLRRQHIEGRRIAAICAAPLLLLDAGLTEDLAYTAHPSTGAELDKIEQGRVVVDGAIITSQGAGTATEFALELVRQLCGESTSTTIAESICWSHPF
jgi:4-methyl-5(b-hydroxyethyl)-thiazole monophosphate biosynthesis